MSNGLGLFETTKEAETAYQAIKQTRTCFDAVRIASLRMEIAENDDEVRNNPVLVNSRSLIVIWTNEMGQQLLGRAVKGKPGLGYIPGARLDGNGIKSIPTHERALHIASEASRQSDRCLATLADFEFQWIR